MPLIILGLIVIIGIVIFWLISNSDIEDGKIDTRPVRERYSHAFEDKAEKAKEAAKDVKDDVTKKIRKRAGIYEADYDIEDDGYGSSTSGESDDNTIPFPDDVEREKKKRDIH